MTKYFMAGGCASKLRAEGSSLACVFASPIHEWRLNSPENDCRMTAVPSALADNFLRLGALSTLRRRKSDSATRASDMPLARDNALLHARDLDARRACIRARCAQRNAERLTGAEAEVS